MFCSTDEKVEKVQSINSICLCKSWWTAPIISPPAGSEEQINVLEKSGKPYVLIDRYFPNINSNSVIIDNFQAATTPQPISLKRISKNACIVLDIALLTLRREFEWL